MDNPQETLPTAYIAGLMEGEGTFALNRVYPKGYKGQPSYRSSISFVNTELILIKAFTEFCECNDINYHVHTDIRDRGHKVCYQLTITSLSSRIKFLDIIEPYMLGNKKEESRLVRLFTQGRLNRTVGYTPVRDLSTGRLLTGGRPKIEQEEIDLYEQYKKFKGSSETTRESPMKIG